MGQAFLTHIPGPSTTLTWGMGGWYYNLILELKLDPHLPAPIKVYV